MSKHTPGPWYCNPENSLHRFGIYAGENEGIIICDVTDEDLTHDGELEANAQLISASPDFYAACKDALCVDGERSMDLPDALRMIGRELRRAGLIGLSECYSDWLDGVADGLRKAMDKADGKETP